MENKRLKPSLIGLLAGGAIALSALGIGGCSSSNKCDLDNTLNYLDDQIEKRNKFEKNDNTYVLKEDDGTTLLNFFVGGKLFTSYKIFKVSNNTQEKKHILGLDYSKNPDLNEIITIYQGTQAIQYEKIKGNWFKKCCKIDDSGYNSSSSGGSSFIDLSIPNSILNNKGKKVSEEELKKYFDLFKDIQNNFKK